MTDVHPRVLRDLQSRNVSHTVRRHRDCPVDIRTPADFANALGYDLSRVTKSVFCRSQAKTSHAVLVCSIAGRVDFKRASAALGTGRWEVASPVELEQITGYPRNGVSPLGLDAGVRVVVARGLLDHDTVLVGAGVLGVEIELTPPDLITATNALVADIA